MIRDFFLTFLNSGMVGGWSGWECAARHMPVTDQPPSAPDLPLHDNNNSNNNNNRPAKTAPDTHIKVNDKSCIKERQNLHNSNRILKSDKTDSVFWENSQFSTKWPSGCIDICCLMHIWRKWCSPRRGIACDVRRPMTSWLDSDRHPVELQVAFGQQGADCPDCSSRPSGKHYSLLIHSIRVGLGEPPCIQVSVWIEKYSWG